MWFILKGKNFLFKDFIFIIKEKAREKENDSVTFSKSVAIHWSNPTPPPSLSIPLPLPTYFAWGFFTFTINYIAAQTVYTRKKEREHGIDFSTINLYEDHPISTAMDSSLSDSNRGATQIMCHPQFSLVSVMLLIKNGRFQVKWLKTTGVNM